MSEEKHQLKVFLCHAHSDKGKVRELYLRLKADGVDAWLDKEKLLPGQDWELEIRKAVRESDVVVVCLSREFNQAGFRQKEVRLALDTAMEKPEGEIFIIPARLEECDTLESLRKWHWVDLFEDVGYEMLVRALRVRAEKVGLTLQVKKRWVPKVPKSSVISEKTDSKTKHPDLDSLSVQLESKTASTSQPINERFRFSRPEKQRNPNKVITVTLVGFAATIVFVLLGLPSIEEMFYSEPVSTTIIATSTSFVPTNTSSPTRTRIPLPTETKDSIGGIEVEMVLVPRGDFVRGSDDYEIDESPEDIIFLDDFFIDKYEVTNALYKVCIDEGPCDPPKKSNLTEGVPEFSIYSNYVDHPIVSVTWDMALAFCNWRGARLPYEFEWEKAARGSDARLYPWGNKFDSSRANFCDLNCTENNEQRNANYDDHFQFTSPVGNYPDGASPYGAHDMAGNVWEWVVGEYHPDGYTYNLQEIFVVSFIYGVPVKTPEPNIHILRGGSWWNSENLLRSSYRLGTDNSADVRIGFRCARDVTP